MTPRNAIRPKPIPSIAQVRGSGMALVAIDSLKPVIEAPGASAKFAVSVIENNPLASNGELCVPAKLSGSLDGVPLVENNSTPGMLSPTPAG